MNRPDLDSGDAWAMLETAPDGVMLVDDTGCLLFVNGQMETLFGYSRQELQGQPVEQLLPDRYRAGHVGHRAGYGEAPRTRAMGSDLNLVARRKDGSEFPVEVSLAPLDPDSGLRVVATVRDITERVAAEAFGHAVQHAINAARDGVFMFSPDTLSFTYVNDGACQQIGYTRAELLQMTPLDIKPEFTENTFREILEPLMDGTVESYDFTTVHRRKDGVEVPVEIIIEYPLPQTRHQPRMLVAFVRDITERHLATRALEASEAAFRTAFDAAPVGIAMVDFTDAVRRPIIDCNRALCELLGFSKDELLKKGFAELTHPDDADESDTSARRAAAGSVTQYAIEKRYIHAEGHAVWAWVHSAVLASADGSPSSVLVHVADLTSRKAAQAERERARQWLAALAEIRAAALADSGLQRTLELVCVHARNLIDADTAIISRPNHHGDEVHVVAYDSPETETQLPNHFTIDDPIRRALGGESFLSGHLETDHRVDQVNRTGAGGLEEITSVLVVPIGTGDTIEALLMMSHRNENSLDEADLATIESFAAEAATVLQLHSARAAQTELRVLQDRERLAQDLHDLVIQRIFASGMALQSTQNLAENPTVVERIAETVDQLDHTIADLRSAIFRLNSPIATRASDEIQTIVDAAASQLGFDPELVLEGDIDGMPEVIREQLCPSLTEALSNVARHADASKASVRITSSNGNLEMTVADNGSGVDPNAAHGNGLLNLHSRAARVGGVAELVDNDDGGGGATLTWTATI